MPKLPRTPLDTEGTIYPWEKAQEHPAQNCTAWLTEKRPRPGPGYRGGIIGAAPESLPANSSYSD
jgi:hypothetical protein